MGLLSDGGAQDWYPAPTNIRRSVQRATALCWERVEDIAKLAIQFSVSNELIASKLVGTANSANIEQNVAWVLEEASRQLLEEVAERSSGEQRCVRRETCC